MQKSIKVITSISIIICLIFIIYFFCTKNKEYYVIKPDKLLIENAESRGINYIYLLEKSTNKDKKSLKVLVNLEFYNANSYDHGVVIVELILLLGEEHFIKSLQNINQKNRKKILSYLNAGIVYNKKVYINSKNIQVLFPEIEAFLKNNA